MVNAALSPSTAAATQQFRRFERKFPVAPAQAALIGAWLRHSCLPDDAFPAGQVTSCYFDTADWDSYFESVDGDSEKRKVRLRWYDALPAAPPVTAFLETKEKSGFATWKRRTPLTVDATLLAQGRFEAVVPVALFEESLARLGVFEAQQLRPAVVVSYARHRFVEPGSGIQLALDAGLRAWPAGGGPAVELGPPVVEIKAPSIALPARLHSLRRWASTWSSRSKYAIAVEALGRALGPGAP